MTTPQFVKLFAEIEADIKDLTKKGYDACDLITLQNRLIFSYSFTIDHYYMNDITVDECKNLKFAIRDMIRKISWSLLEHSYRDNNWLEEFNRSLDN